MNPPFINTPKGDIERDLTDDLLIRDRETRIFNEPTLTDTLTIEGDGRMLVI